MSNRCEEVKTRKNMPRIRSIKPEFWKVTHDLSEGAALLFIGLWNFSDDYGVVELDPDLIKANIYPKRPVEIGTIESRIDELYSTERVIPFRCNGVSYGWMPAFSEHQVINKKSQTRFPAPPPDMVHEYESKRNEERYEYSSHISLGFIS